MMRVTYDYDANGNRVKKEQFDLTGRDELHHSIVDYAYDYENRLVATERDYHHNVGSQCNEPGSCLLELPGYAYAYDGNGLRVSAMHDGSTRGFDYDGLDVIVEHDGAGNMRSAFTRAPGFAGGIGGVVGYTDHTDAQNPEHWNYHYDQLGSVGNLSNNGSDGKNVMIYYDAFGRQRPVGNKDAPYQQGFSSKEYEGFDYIEDTLVYFGARYYDPEVGRWLTKDPLGFVDGPNVYTYVRNNPVNLFDAYGFAGERQSERYLTRQKELLRRQYKNLPSLGNKILDSFLEDSVLGATDQAFGTKISLAISTAKTSLDIINTLKDDHPNLDNFEKTKLITAQVGGSVLTISGSVGGGAIGLLFSGGNPVIGVVGGAAGAATIGIAVADDINNLRERYYLN